MDSQSSVHVYGQVWHMVDPICGAKEEGSRPPLLSAIVHNNRYGVIVQRTETITGNSILMVPCSTSNSIPHDVNFSIVTERLTAGRVRALYPVHPRCLDRYVCTLSPLIMKKMEMEIVKLLCPTIHSACMNGTLDFLDHNQSLYEQVATRITLANVKAVLESFVQEKIRFTGFTTDVLDIMTLKTAFDEFCLSRGYEIMADHLEFIEHFQESFGADGAKPLSELMEIRAYPGMQLKEDICAKQEIPLPPGNNITFAGASQANTLVSTSAKKWNKWSEEKIEEFVEYYRKFGADETSKLYNIEPSTAKTYFNRWDGREEEETVVESDVLPTKGAAESNLADVKYAPQAIHKLANIMKDVMHEEDVFVYVHSHVKGKQKIYPETFYKRFHTCVQTSLLDFLKIKKISDGKHNIPEITEESEFLSTWKFLDIIYNNSDLAYQKNGKAFMRKFREEFDGTLGIDKEWITFVSPRLIKMLDLTKGGLEHMCQLLRVEFCDTSNTDEDD